MRSAAAAALDAYMSLGCRFCTCGEREMTVVTGTAANDVLVGTNNDDVLNGLTGADKMSGGAGNDIYFVDQAGDVVTELANKGTEDWIVSTISTILAANVEHLELVGGALNGTGDGL